HACDLHLRFRSSQQVGARHRERPSPVFYSCPRHAGADWLRRRIRHHRHRALPDGGIDVAIAVRRLTAHGHERRPRTDPSRIVMQGVDLGFSLLHFDYHARKQFVESHFDESILKIQGIPARLGPARAADLFLPPEMLTWRISPPPATLVLPVSLPAATAPALRR